MPAFKGLNLNKYELGFPRRNWDYCCCSWSGSVGMDTVHWTGCCYNFSIMTSQRTSCVAVFCLGPLLKFIFFVRLFQGDFCVYIYILIVDLIVACWVFLADRQSNTIFKIQHMKQWIQEKLFHNFVTSLMFRETTRTCSRPSLLKLQHRSCSNHDILLW